MGFKEVIDSKLSNLSKDTHLVNNRTTIHFKSTNTEVRGEGCFRVLSIYTFFIARNFFPQSNFSLPIFAAEGILYCFFWINPIHLTVWD